MSSPPRIRLPAEAAAAAAPIRARHPGVGLPASPYRTLIRLVEPSWQEQLAGPDVIDALNVLDASRHWLNWVEFRHLRRAAHAHYVIEATQYELVGPALGISSSGITRRRQRLARLIADRGRVKNSPSLPPTSLDAAVDAAAALLLEHRADRVPRPVPASEDLIGVASHAAVWHNTPDLDCLAADITAAMTVVVALRWHFDALELVLLDTGRDRIGMSNTELGRPLGRHGLRATWRARARLRNGAAGFRRVPAHVPAFDDEPAAVDEPETVIDADVHDAELAGAVRQIITRLLKFRPVINDEGLDVWIGWLAERVDHPVDRGTFGLLWALAEEITAGPRSHKVEGLLELAKQIEHLLSGRRDHG